MVQFQVANGKSVHPHIFIFGNAADIADVLLVADTADTVLEVGLADSMQTDVGDQLSLPLAADTASSS